MESFIEYGYIGLFLASFLASTIIPLSSEAVLLGLLLLKFNPIACVAVASAGNFSGGLTTYGLGYMGKWDWVEKFLKIKKEKVEVFHYKIQRYGSFAGLITWLPLVGDIIALSMGFMRTNFILSSIFMLIGRTLRYIILTIIFLKYYN